MSAPGNPMPPPGGGNDPKLVGLAMQLLKLEIARGMIVMQAMQAQGLMPQQGGGGGAPQPPAPRTQPTGSQSSGMVPAR